MTYLMKPSDVYYNGRPTIPSGKKVIDFRRPNFGELFMADTGGLCCRAGTAEVNCIRTPRLILADCEPEVDWWE